MREPMISAHEWDAWCSELSGVGLAVMGVMHPTQLDDRLQRHVLDYAPEAMQAPQWWVIGHQGRKLWETICDAYQVTSLANATSEEHPIDMWVRRFLTARIRQRAWHAHVWTPDDAGEIGVAAPLQGIGRALGWRHTAPFQLSIDETWGTWFAYRAVICATSLAPWSEPKQQRNPCEACVSRPCESACPAGACAPSWRGDRCQSHRLACNSSCQHDCLARRACPVGSVHAYSREQMRDHSLPSLNVITELARSKPGTR